MAKKLIDALRVVAKAETFRRAGYTFTREPRDIPASEFDSEEGDAKLLQLRDEKMLFCTPVQIEVDVPDETAADAAVSPAVKSAGKK